MDSGGSVLKDRRIYSCLVHASLWKKTSASSSKSADGTADWARQETNFFSSKLQTPPAPKASLQIHRSGGCWDEMRWTRTAWVPKAHHTWDGCWRLEAKVLVGRKRRKAGAAVRTERVFSLSYGYVITRAIPDLAIASSRFRCRIVSTSAISHGVFSLYTNHMAAHIGMLARSTERRPQA